MISIKIDTNACTGCRFCEKQCPTEVFVVKNNKSEVADIENCMACKLCETVCPQLGIKVIEE